MSWFTVCGNTNLELESQVKRSISNRLAAKNFTEADLEYIKKLDFTPRLSANSDLKNDQKLFAMLRELCKLCDSKPQALSITSHRPFVGPIIVASKKILYAVFGAFLKSREEQQRKFNAATLEVLIKLAGRN
jgi:hypothetical protein